MGSNYCLEQKYHKP